MKLEVDSTTGQLVHELEASISGTIESLRSGQTELSNLISEIHQLQKDLAKAQSEQVDELYGIVTKVSTDIGGKASAKQVKEAAEEAKALLTESELEIAGIKDTQDRMLEKQRVLQDAQAELGSKLQGLTEAQEATPQAVAALLEDKLRAISALEKQFNTFSSLLSAQKDGLVRSAENALNAANRNQTSLNAIMAYLSLPGYKRFFKGMEVPADEISA